MTCRKQGELLLAVFQRFLSSFFWFRLEFSADLSYSTDFSVKSYMQSASDLSLGGSEATEWVLAGNLIKDALAKRQKDAKAVTCEL